MFVFWAFIGGGKPSFLAKGLQEKEKDALDKLTRRFSAGILWVGKSCTLDG